MEELVNYGKALEAVKEGKLIARQGWNGKGMFVFMRPSDMLNVDFIINKVKSLPQSFKDYFNNKEFFDMEGNALSNELINIPFTAYLCMYAADGSVVNGWLASQTDMLSEDWTVLN